MKIIKRDGRQSEFAPNKILTRIKNLSKDLKIDSALLFKIVIPNITEGMTTTEIDEIIAFKAADNIIKHPDYSLLGGRLLMSRQSKLIGKDLTDVDLSYDFFAAYTFLKKYSVKNTDKIPLELPFGMYSRIANTLYPRDLASRKELMTELTHKRINFASPILTNCGVDKRGGMISCNLTHIYSDSLEGIQKTMDKTAKASKEGSGIGLYIDPIRSKQSMVSSFKNNAGGPFRMMKMFEPQMQFYKQGDRSGSMSPYISLWHRDVEDIIESTLPIGEEKLRTRNLYPAIIINDLFMEKLQAKEPWYTFCPNNIMKAGLPPLQDVLGQEFKKVYNKAVALGIGTEIDSQALWFKLIRSMVESGRPYVLFKESMNKRNMQDNIGLIYQSNLCSEILQASKPGYTPQCTLASINLAKQTGIGSIKRSTKVLVKALNRVIDINKWSDEWSEKAGLDQRALAIGVAGLAEFFAQRKISFESKEAKQWNTDIFETMYKSAIQQSNALAVMEGKTYPAWEGSRYSKGETYIPGWTPGAEGAPIPLMNSLFIGLMPTASSAILLGAFESFEPVTSNLFVREVGQGNFVIINQYLVRELEDLKLWDAEMSAKIVKDDGSVQNIDEIPEEVRFRYKTVWEISQKVLMDLAIIRNQFVDQSQSMNLYYTDAKVSKISSALMYAWKQGLKTGVYYTRTKSALKTNSKLSAGLTSKPVDSPYDCFGCSA